MNTPKKGGRTCEGIGCLRDNFEFYTTVDLPVQVCIVRLERLAFSVTFLYQARRLHTMVDKVRSNRLYTFLGELQVVCRSTHIVCMPPYFNANFSVFIEESNDFIKVCNRLFLKLKFIEVEEN